MMKSFDLGLSPDEPNPFNEASTMYKTLEYMAAGLPIVAFGLREAQRVCGPAGAYASEANPDGLARAIAGLLSDPGRRREMAVEAANRAKLFSRENAERAFLTALGVGMADDR